MIKRKIVSSIIIVVIIFIVVAIIIVYVGYPVREKQKLNYKKWEFSKDSLALFLSRNIYNTEDIQFYRPYRGKGLEYILRVIYKDSIYFDLKEETLSEINNISVQRFDNLLLHENNMSKKNIKNNIIKQLRKIDALGIYSMIKTDSSSKIVTRFYDSSYVDIQKQDTSKKSEQYDEVNIKDLENPEKLLLGFYFFKIKPSSNIIKLYEKKYISIRQLNSNCYFFRTLH